MRTTGGTTPKRGAHTPHVSQGPLSSAENATHTSELIAKRKKGKRLKKVLLGVLIALVAIVGGAGIGVALYLGSISGNIALDEETRNALDGLLADSSADAFYVLVIGSDEWEGISARSDAIVLTRIDPKNHQVTMVSVPRDTPYIYQGQKCKLNHLYEAEGAAGIVRGVQEVTGVKISHYVEIGFEGLSEFIDSIGGITVDIPYAFDYQVYTHDRPTVHINAGTQTLNGEEAVAVARNRTSYDGNQDATRQSNIRIIALGLINRILDAPVTEIPGLLQSFTECVSTDIELGTMVNWATDFAGSGGTTIYTCTGPFDGDIDSETGLWLCYEDPEGWKELMRKVDAGLDPDSE